MQRGTPKKSESALPNSFEDSPIKISKMKNNFFSAQVKIDDVTLENVIINSSLIDRNPVTQAKNVLAAFNVNVVKDQSAFETSLLIGEWVKPGKYILGACNQIPELGFHNGAQKIRRAWYLDPFINTEIKTQHGQSDLFFGAYGSYVLNVPVNTYALGWSGNVPLIFNTGPHVVHDANFKFDPKNGLVNQSNPYINHGSIHILRVPAGMLAKIWIGATPHLLDSREEPYIFDTPLFNLAKKDDASLFYSATDPLIIHGSIKRLMPHTGQVAITYDNGNLKIIGPNKDGYPTIIESATHEVRGFINTNVQAPDFPSEAEKKKRSKNNPNISADELNHYVFTTKDNLKICMKLLVSYRIIDPNTTLSQLGENNIQSTVESLASVDMGKMVIRLSSQEFMNPYSARQEAKKKSDSKSPDEEEEIQPSFWDEIRTNLSDELKTYGIELIRFNIETPFVLDKEIAKEMSKFATLNAKANAEQAVIIKQAQVKKAEAERDAMTKQIEQGQSNAALISKNKAELKAEKLRAKARKIQAKAEAKYIETIGEAYRNNPALLELEKTKQVAQAVAKMNWLVPFPTQSSHHAMNPGNYDSFNRFFQSEPQSISNQDDQNVISLEGPRVKSVS